MRDGYAVVIEKLYSSWSNGWAGGSDSIGDNRTLIIDKNGTVTCELPEEYNKEASGGGANLWYFSTQMGLGWCGEGLFAFSGYTDTITTLGYMDPTGKTVIDLKGRGYISLYPFSEGLAAVKNQDEKIGFIDKTGALVIPCAFDASSDFCDGLCPVQKDGKWGYIDKSGNVVIPFEYDDAYGAGSGLASVVKNGKCGLVDYDNNIVVPLEYDDISSYEDSVAYGIKDGVVYLITNYNADVPDIPDKTYTITFDPNGGTVVPTSVKTTVDGKLTSLPTPIRTNYSFQGWYTAANGGNIVTTDTVFTQDTAVYAHWNYIGSSGPSGDNPIGGGTNGNADSSGNTSTPSYTITAPVVDGGTVTVSPKSAQKGDTVTITAIPKTGYELLSLAVNDGSKEIPLTNAGNGKYTFIMPESKVTVSAEFQAAQPTPVPVPETPWSNPFTDISEGNWYYDAVKFVSENSLMNGIGNGVFAPDAYLSRAMLAQILYNKEGKPAVTQSSTFTDVTPGDWYYDAVTWAAANNIVSGYGDGLYGSNNSITREQLAVMLWRYAGEPAATGKELHFSDASAVSGYAMDALCWATENGIINGKGGNILDPQGQATRAQVAQMLMNYLRK